jgi:hypothetical protein
VKTRAEKQEEIFQKIQQSKNSCTQHSCIKPAKFFVEGVKQITKQNKNIN